MRRKSPTSGWTLLSTFLLLAACGRAGFGPPDAGVDADADTGADTEPVFLGATPEVVSDAWVQKDTLVSHDVIVTRSDDGPLDDLQTFVREPWLSVALADPAGDARVATLTVDSAQLTVGSHATEITFSLPASNVLPTSVRVEVAVWELAHVHVGPDADTCPHVDELGAPTTTCDFAGPDGLIEAAASVPGGYAWIQLYDNLGERATFNGCVVLPGHLWLSAAPLVDPANVVVACGSPPEDNPPGVLALSGDRVLIERITLVCRAGSNGAVFAWPAGNQPESATSGHTIRNVVAAALEPEFLGANSIEAPLWLGSNTTVQNCHFYGFFESIDLGSANHTRFLHNTFVFFQGLGAVFRVEGSSDITVANNVVIALSRTMDALVTASPDTNNLTVVGNVFEEALDVVTGLDPDDPYNLVSDNVMAPVEVESPLVPRFLFDATQTASAQVAGEGVSLDGVDLTIANGLLPGAYQQRSDRSLPRREVIRVGPEPGGCGGEPCDILASGDNEIQKAVWSAWRGRPVEVYPSAEPYAGNAVITWQVSLQGKGAGPEDAVLMSREEDSFLNEGELWGPHQSLITVLRTTRDPIAIENLTLRVDTDTVADDRAVLLEGADDYAPSGLPTLRRLRIDSVNEGSGLGQALFLGSNVLVQDVLVHGDFESCIRFGVRGSSSRATPLTEGGRIVNLTCRLTGLSHTIRSAFDVAAVSGLHVVNLALELASPAPLFRAQRRSSGDEDPIALDVPQSLTLQAASIRGTSGDFDGFTSAEGTYTVGYDPVAAGEPFFASDTDSHLDASAEAIDSGIDPSTVDPELLPGTSLDGVPRAGRQIDRGAYEQGN